MWRMSIPLAIHQFPRSPHIFCAFCPVLSLLLLWTVLLGCHQDLWFCNLLSDGFHEQPLNEVVEVLSPNILVQFHSLPYHGTSLHNTLSTCLRFGQLQSNFRQLLTGYIAGMVETFKSLIWLSERPVWNFLSCLLLLVPHICLPAAAVYPLSFSCTSAFSSWYWFLSLPFASLFSLITACHQISNSFSSATWRLQLFLWPFPAGLFGTFPESFWGYLIMCSLQYRKPIGHLCCKLYCFFFLEFLEIQRRNAVMSFIF